MTGRRSRLALALVALTAVLSVALAGTAQAAVTSRAEVSGDRLRIEGTATASRPITVDGVQMATSSSSGTFKIDRSSYTPPADCTVDVNDGSAAPVNVRLSGCTVTAPALSSLSLSPATVQGGATASATVTLTAPAPAGGAVVSLTSSNIGAVTVPATLTVPAGATSAATSAVATSAVTSTTTSVISATYNGMTRTATMTVTPPAPPAPTATLDTVSLSPASVGQAGVCGDLWPGRVSGRLPHAGHQRGHGWSLRQPPRTWQLVWRAAGHGSGTAATAGHSRVQTSWAWSVSCQHGDPTAHAGNRSGLPQTSPTLPLWPSAVPSRFRTPWTECRVRCLPGGCGG
jgi:hypothetical protein